MGREKKYTARALAEAAEAYLDSIRREMEITEPVPTGETDRYGHPVFRYEPVRDRNGSVMKRIDYVEPPTVGGLCRALGISRQTWASYLGDEDEARRKAAQAVKDELQAWNERELLVREGKNLSGIVFNLQNNYGYGGQKTEVELGEKAAAAVRVPAPMPLSQRRELLEQIAAEFGGGRDG